jgi:hypothetical protein
VLIKKNNDEVLHMKILKSAIVAFSLALSLGAFSTSAVACEDGRVCYEPEEAINMVLQNIKAATDAIESGSEGEVVADLIKAAISANKEINANDTVDRNRQRANGLLKKARKAARKEQLQVAEEYLKQAKKKFEALKGML